VGIRSGILIWGLWIGSMLRGSLLSGFGSSNRSLHSLLLRVGLGGSDWLRVLFNWSRYRWLARNLSLALSRGA
jgi:hypothetical protein